MPAYTSDGGHACAPFQGIHFSCEGTGQVAAGTGGRPGNGRQRAVRPYRKRKPLPALIFIGVLGVAAVTVWVNVISSSGDIAEAVACEPRPMPPADTTFTPLPYDALATTAPLPPSQVEVTVLNANNTRGEASIATEALRQLGFTRVTDPGNDEVYTGDTVAECHGQIRFGAPGERAARTVHLLNPCLELIRDNREDPTVDLAIGTKFNDVSPSGVAVEILDRLKSWSAENEHTETDEQSARQDGPVIDQELLTQTLPKHC
ncbi:envelope integrity protein Cei [Saccharomonospora azurea]|uniref:envelope integrity protein Cei n=1 Tax=Saccharomonospora azurea TaxID=40988 RepID=UPI0033230C9C